jgi:N-acetylglucosamine malate deacetylase 1
MNVLVIAPHPDDETIGCGGTLCLHHERGDRIAVAYLTSGELGLKALKTKTAWRIREREARIAADLIGIAKTVFLRLPDWYLGTAIKQAAAALCPILKTESPELIYLPHPAEWHPDHRATLEVLQLALERARIPVPELRAYEVWTPLSEYDFVEDITSMMPCKLRALEAYQSQLSEFAYERAVRGLNEFRGALAGKCLYAEVFQRPRLKKTKRIQRSAP